MGFRRGVECLMSLAILGSLDTASKSQALALWAMSWTIHHNWLRSFGQAPNLRRGMMGGGGVLTLGRLFLAKTRTVTL